MWKESGHYRGSYNKLTSWGWLINVCVSYQRTLVRLWSNKDLTSAFRGESFTWNQESLSGDQYVFVQLRRGRGDTQEWNNFIKTLIHWCAESNERERSCSVTAIEQVKGLPVSNKLFGKLWGGWKNMNLIIIIMISLYVKPFFFFRELISVIKRCKYTIYL